MKQLPSSVARPLIRIAYLMPAISGLVMLALACVPHIFFFYNGAPYDTQSPFVLMSNTWREAQAMLTAQTTGSGGAYFFALFMSISTVLSWICIIFYGTTAIAAAICSGVAFAHAPTDRLANRAKRWMQFFCPGRVLYVISNLLLLLPASFPYLLQHCYRTQLGYHMRLYFIGVSDLLLCGILITLNLTAFLTLLSAQTREQMDMFRIVKQKKPIE